MNVNFAIDNLRRPPLVRAVCIAVVFVVAFGSVTADYTFFFFSYIII